MVSNWWDGTVEAVFAREEDAVERLVASCREGCAPLKSTALPAMLADRQTCGFCGDNRLRPLVALPGSMNAP
jgi:acylphosphatase